MSSGGGHIGSAGAVSVDDVLSHLETRSMVPSSIGAVLARARDGLGVGNTDPAGIAERQHTRMLRQAAVLRCVEAILAVDRFPGDFQKDLHKAAELTGRNEGFVVVSVLRAFQQWALISTERGYAEVFCWLQRATGSEKHGETTADRFAEQFRLDKAKNARGRARGLERDCRAVLESWVLAWNKKQKE